MIKKCLLATVIVMTLCTITNRSAAKGPIQFGIKAGIQSQSIHASKDEVLGMFSADKDFGYQLGFVARVNLPMFYIQPELVYASHRFTMDMEDNASTKVKIKNMEVPVLFGWKNCLYQTLCRTRIHHHDRHRKQNAEYDYGKSMRSSPNRSWPMKWEAV